MYKLDKRGSTENMNNCQTCTNVNDCGTCAGGYTLDETNKICWRV